MKEEIYISLCNDGVAGTPVRRRRGLFFRRAQNLRLTTSKTFAKGGEHYLILFSTAFLVLLTLLTMYPMPFHHGQAVAEPGIPNPSTTSITLTSVSSNTSVRLTPGTGFKLSEVADTASYSVTTDNFTGYNIKLIAPNDSRTLVNTDDSAKVMNSITTPVDESSFVKTSTTLMNRFGIKPNKYRSGGSTIVNVSTILPAPDTEGVELDSTTSANTSVANNYNVALGAMVDGTLPSGTYTMVGTLVATSNPIYYTLNFNKNTAETVTNLPATQTGSTTATEITIPNLTPLRANYVFMGWCKGVTVTTDGVDACYVPDAGGNPTSTPGTVFQPGDDYGIDQTVENTSTLYAMWEVDTYTITYGTTNGISSVSLDGAACTTALSSGGCTKSLTYGYTYSLVATPATGYSFTSWNAGDYGTIADTTSTGANTTYTVGGGASTITPTATVNKYTCTKQYRLQNADGTWGGYTTDATEQVDYGTTCSYSKTVTNYKGSDTGANDSAGTTSGTMTTAGLTLKIDMYRNTYTVALTKGTGISAVSVTGTGVKSGSGTGSATVYHGGDITIGATLTTGNYIFDNWTTTGSTTVAYTAQSQAISNVTTNLAYTANAYACGITAGKTYTYAYTGAQQSLVVPCRGYYKLEVWGAQGGNTSVYYSGTSHRGGYGGYAVGVLKSEKNDNLYINVGGAGSQVSCSSGGCSTAQTANGGYNGGGAAKLLFTAASSVGSGGGATHIASVSGTLNNLSSYKGTLVSNSYYDSSSIFIVAGGGGGGTSYDSSNASYGGEGGGIKGGTAQNVETGYYATGGTQTAGGYNGAYSDVTQLIGVFGRGASGTYTTTSSYYSGGGGGGFFGGGASMPNSRITGGGGGSGYVGSSKLISAGGVTKHMTCYSCTTSSVAATRTNTSTNVSSTATADYSKTGNGYAIITYLGLNI